MMNNDSFAPGALAADLITVRQMYADFFAGLTASDWRYPAEVEDNAWNLREVVAHIGSLAEFGQASIEAALRGQAIAFPGLPDRYAFSQFNRRQIDQRLQEAPQTLGAALLDALSCSIDTAMALREEQTGCTVDLPIYNRPVRVDELLGIQMMHVGLTHAAQVAEPAGIEPLWRHLEPDVRQRTVGRVARALSLLYRRDLGGDLRAVIALHVGGEGGGDWRVWLSPDDAGSAAGAAENATLTLSFRDTGQFCRMFTRRLNLPVAILTGGMRPRGDLRLFLRFGSLFSVDGAA